MSTPQLDKTYEPKAVEARWSQVWNSKAISVPRRPIPANRTVSSFLRPTSQARSMSAMR